ncbi:MAG: hypothetical protein QOI77_2050 [Blastocatellia bacterium]|nr:hypothetical protein [Blastocatellia bacterium]
MTTTKHILFASTFVLALLSTAIGQESTNTAGLGTSLTITAAAAVERVRIAAPASVVQMHVEIYAAGGEKLFDQEIRGGNVFDWHLQDAQGQRLAPGTYVCVITAKNISGKLTQKIGTVSIEEKSVSVQPATSPQLSVQQMQVIGPVEDNSSWTIPGKDEPQTPTVIANDGTDGQMIRGRGALSFRIGNFFTGNDTEQMRLTEAGDLGIGSSEPRAKLDVAGTIRAERFLIVKPGKPVSTNKTAANTLSADTVEPDQSLISGSGTQDRIAKWTDNSGTLGDSGITETAGGFVGIGTTAPSAKLVVSLNSATLPPATGIARFADADGVQTTVFADSFGTNPIFNVRRANGTAAAPSALQASQLIGVIGASGYGASAYSGTRARVGFFASENWTNTANGTYLTFNTTANGAATAGGTERMRIDNAGNVGIGTTPGDTIKLDVAGSTRITPGNGYSISLGAPNGDTGMTLLKPDIGRADVRFDGTTLRLVAGAPHVPPPPSSGIAISGTSGNVGIGASGVFSDVKLAVDGGSQTAVYGLSNGSVGVIGYGINGQGVEGQSTGSGIALYGLSDAGPALAVRSNTGVLMEGYPNTTTLGRSFHINLNGTYVAGSDFAESLPARGNKSDYEPGDVLVASTKAAGQVEKTNRPYDVRVAGIYSTRPGMLGAEKAGATRIDAGEVPVAIVGIVPTKVSTINGKIQVGDLLTTSSLPGYAMRCADRAKCVGAIVGKALEPLAAGKSVIRVLVMLR